jgi:hypothetical protein
MEGLVVWSSDRGVEGVVGGVDRQRVEVEGWVGG